MLGLEAAEEAGKHLVAGMAFTSGSINFARPKYAGGRRRSIDRRVP
jgi:hypothetical protein